MEYHFVYDLRLIWPNVREICGKKQTQLNTFIVSKTVYKLGYLGYRFLNKGLPTTRFPCWKDDSGSMEACRYFTIFYFTGQLLRNAKTKYNAIRWFKRGRLLLLPLFFDKCLWCVIFQWSVEAMPNIFLSSFISQK